MDYFLLKQDKRYTNTPRFMELFNKMDVRNINLLNVHKIEDIIVFKVKVDGRVNSTYNTAQVITLVLLCFLLRIKSFNELNLMITNNEFRELFRRGTVATG